MWRNIAEIGKTQKKIWCMRIACWKLKLHTHSKYVIIMAFFKEQFAAKTRLIITLYAHICLVKFPYVINIPV